MKKLKRKIIFSIVIIFSIILYSLLSFTLPVYHYVSSDNKWEDIEVPWKGRDLNIVLLNFEKYKKENNKENVELLITSKKIWYAPNLWWDNMTNKRWKLKYIKK